MLARTKKPLTKKDVDYEAIYNKKNFLCVCEANEVYLIPKKIAKHYLVVFNKDSFDHVESNTVSSEEIFGNFYSQFSKAGALLKGVRMRENLSQVEFANRINVTQANLSKMENGKRPIGKQIAKRIEKEFGVCYKYFLE